MPGTRSLQWLTHRALALWALCAMAPATAQSDERGIERQPLSFEEMQREQRVALVVGNSAYQHTSTLVNPARDAQALADALAGMGFELIGGGALLDLDQVGMFRAIADFEKRLADGQVGLFYYSGHGVQVDGENHMVPVDADLPSEIDVDAEAVSTQKLLRAMARSGNRLNIVILDACRNNPFEEQWFASGFQERTRSASVGAGLATVNAASGFFIAYATAPGAVALDGAGDMGPYAAALLAELEPEGRTLESVFRGVHARVYEQTDRKQMPWTSQALGPGAFYFKLPPEAGGVETLSATSGALQVTARRGGTVTIDGVEQGEVAPFESMQISGLRPGPRLVCVDQECQEHVLEPGAEAALTFEGVAKTEIVEIKPGRTLRIAGGAAALTGIALGASTWGLITSDTVTSGNSGIWRGANAAGWALAGVGGATFAAGVGVGLRATAAPGGYALGWTGRF